MYTNVYEKLWMDEKNTNSKEVYSVKNFNYSPVVSFITCIFVNVELFWKFSVKFCDTFVEKRIIKLD